jgi:hypothetical protein
LHGGNSVLDIGPAKVCEPFAERFGSEVPAAVCELRKRVRKRTSVLRDDLIGAQDQAGSCVREDARAFAHCAGLA